MTQAGEFLDWCMEQYDEDDRWFVEAWFYGMLQSWENRENKMERIKEQIKKIEADMEKNARMISDFCVRAGMSSAEAGAAAALVSASACAKAIVEDPGKV